MLMGAGAGMSNMNTRSTQGMGSQYGGLGNMNDYGGKKSSYGGMGSPDMGMGGGLRTSQMQRQGSQYGGGMN